MAIAVSRTTRSQELALRAAATVPDPVWPKLPSADAFVPLVFLLAVIIPGFFTWFYGELTVAQSEWAMRGLAILDSGRWGAFAPTESAPPFHAWSTALALTFPFESRLWAPSLPSYFFGFASIVMVYALGRFCYSPGVGLLTAFLVTVNHYFLMQIQRGEPSVATLFWGLAVLLCYLQRLKSEEIFSLWTVAAAISFAALLLSAGLFAFWAPLIGLFNLACHQIHRQEDLPGAFRSTMFSPVAVAGSLAVFGGLLLAAPWLLRLEWHSGPYAPWAATAMETFPSRSILSTLIIAMPATSVLGLVGFWRAIHDSWKSESDSAISAFPLLWSLIACLALQTTSPTPAALLFAIVPVTFLAARTLFDIIERKIHDRGVFWIMFASALVFLYSQITPLQLVPQAFVSGIDLSAEQKLDFHLGIDALAITAALVAWLYSRTSRRDSARRVLFGGFVVSTILLACAPNIGQLGQPRRREDPWFKTYQTLEGLGSFDPIIFVGSEKPPAPLQFIVSVVFPESNQKWTSSRAELGPLLQSSGDRPMVLITETSQKPINNNISAPRGDRTISLTQVYDSQVVTAYAPAADVRPTTTESPR